MGATAMAGKRFADSITAQRGWKIVTLYTNSKSNFNVPDKYYTACGKNPFLIRYFNIDKFPFAYRYSRLGMPSGKEAFFAHVFQIRVFIIKVNRQTPCWI